MPGRVIIQSGPVGAGKTTVARALIPLLPETVAYIEGDTFWSFIARGGQRSRRDALPSKTIGRIVPRWRRAFGMVSIKNCFA